MAIPSAIFPSVKYDASIKRQTAPAIAFITFVFPQALACSLKHNCIHSIKSAFRQGYVEHVSFNVTGGPTSTSYGDKARSGRPIPNPTIYRG
jgi:hypothetical protein